MRNFDEERAERYSRDTTFKIGGETFKFRIGMRPELYAEITREYRESLGQVTPALEAIRIADHTIEGFLVDEEEINRWRALREREDDPITQWDMGQVIVFMLGEQMGRPTAAPSSTGNGRSETGQISTEPSSSAPAGQVVSEA